MCTQTTPVNPPRDRETAPSRLRNRAQHWGYIAVAFHWLVALAVVGLFSLGMWMTDLTYYDPWYKQAPDLHKSIGITLLAVYLARLVWRLSDRQPDPVIGHSDLVLKVAHATHWILYGGLFVVMVSGYLISTADGRAISVFGLFDVPAMITSIDKQEDLAGIIHKWLAISLISLAIAHALAALKHHFYDKDNTLKRMLARPSPPQCKGPSS